MSLKLRILFCFLMITALTFGFIQIYFPGSQYNFERLHIFLFNLCTGGTILLYYTEAYEKVSQTCLLFFTASLFYTFSAFLELYSFSIAVSALLFVLVEKVRIKRFSFLPLGFFKKEEAVSEKFHQAALLCLSIGLLLSGLVIINNEYIKIVTMEKLRLDIFFLGFSFPVSLITFSIVFSMLRNIESNGFKRVMEYCFWSITLGVVIFFILILYERLILQLFVTIILLCAVFTIFVLYNKFAQNAQKKQFLSSGIGFLLFTAITGIIYIFFELGPDYEPERIKWLLHIHVFASLYGWNICGLAVICRFNDFPIRFPTIFHIKAKATLPVIIGLHWLVALILAPLGMFYGALAILAVPIYGFIIFTLFISSKKTKLS